MKPAHWIGILVAAAAVGLWACGGGTPTGTNTGGPDGGTTGKTDGGSDGGKTDAGIPPPQITTSSLPSVGIGQSYRFQLEADGGQPPYDWRFAENPSAPNWLRLDETTGLLHTPDGGPLPSVAQDAGFTVILRDSEKPAQTNSAALYIVVTTCDPSAPCWVPGQDACLVGNNQCDGEGRVIGCELPGSPVGSSSTGHCGSDGGSCGRCGSDPGYQCVDGNCSCNGDAGICPGGSNCCPDGCVELKSDVNNCGRCGAACPGVDGGTPACNGSCYDTCNGTLRNCDSGPDPMSSDGGDPTGCEVDISNDVNNCGGCGEVCPAVDGGTPQCGGENCYATCNGTLRNCDYGSDHLTSNASDPTGCEVDISNDANNCNACGNKCATEPNSTPQCANSTCYGTCNGTYRNCSLGFTQHDVTNGADTDGCETDISSDSESCGVCGNACDVWGTVDGGIVRCPCNDGVCSIKTKQCHQTSSGNTLCVNVCARPDGGSP